MNITIPDGVLMYGYCAFGALLIWSKTTSQKKKMYSYGDIIEVIFTSPKMVIIVQFMVFVLFGGLIAKIMVSPSTEMQAMAAGLAWSRLTMRD